MLDDMLTTSILGGPVVDHLAIITRMDNMEIQTFITRGQHVIQHGVVSGGRSALPMRGFHVRKVYA